MPYDSNGFLDPQVPTMQLGIEAVLKKAVEQQCIAGIRNRTRLSLHISQGPSCFLGSITLARNLVLPACPLSLLFFPSASITPVPPRCLIERELLSICRIHEHRHLVSGVYYYYYSILYFCRPPSWILRTQKERKPPPALQALPA